MALDFSKPVQTRSGMKVTILTAEARGRFSVIGMIHEPTIDSATTWTAEGAFHGDGREAPDDLVQVAETVKRYLPVYDDGSAGDLNNGALKKGYATPRESVSATDPRARYILELVYDGRRLGSVNIIRRGEVTP